MTSIQPSAKKTMRKRITTAEWFRQAQPFMRSPFFVWGVIVAVAVCSLEVILRINHPVWFLAADTNSYIYAASNVVDHRSLVDFYRSPGYPLMWVVVTKLAGSHAMGALYLLQQALWVLSALEVFALVGIITRRPAVSAAVALLAGLNFYPLSYANLLIADSLTGFFVTTLALCVAIFLYRPRTLTLWLVTLAMAATMLTLSEWFFFPVVLFAYLTWMAWRRGLLRALGRHLAGGFASLLGVAGLYIYTNGALNGFYGISFVQNPNLLGKLLQYHMTGAGPGYEILDQRVGAFLTTPRGWDPWTFGLMHPEVSRDYWALGGNYARSVILHHPVQYVMDTIPLIFNPPIYWSFDAVQPGRPFADFLSTLQAIGRYSYGLLAFAALFGIVWATLLFFRPTAKHLVAEVMTAIALIVCFDHAITVTASYADYQRLQAPTAQMATVLTFGTFILIFAVIADVYAHARSEGSARPAVEAIPAVAAMSVGAIGMVVDRDASAAQREREVGAAMSHASAMVPRAPLGQGGLMRSQEGSSAMNQVRDGVTGVVIMGAGPAGLTAGYELMRYQVPVLVLEKDSQYVGGISRTVEHRGYRFDIGGHRFFSKSEEVEDFWTEILGPEMLTRGRLSRILYKGKYFDYPLKAGNALLNMGPVETVRCMSSYAWARIHPVRNPKNLEEWVSNQFGHRLFSIFFKTYTEKVWGMSTKELSADWAAQRIKGLDLSQAIKSALLPNRKSGKKGAGKNGQDRKAVITTLIDEFRYPRLGPGEMWERVRDRLREGGNTVAMGQDVVAIRQTPGQGVQAIVARDADGREHEVRGSHFISTLPIRELIAKCDPALPPEVQHAANSLNYRDFLTIAVVINKPNMFPDNWIYLHDPSVKMGRIQNFKNWSPEMVADPNTTCLGLEYFCFEGDGLWASSDEELVELARSELATLKLCKPEELLWGVVVRQPKAYPVYDDVYKQHLAVIKDYIERELPNLQLVGRNGMHHYNNQDHSMMTALLAARNIALGTSYDPWKVNTDAEYHEEARLEDEDASGRQVPKRVPALAQVEK